MRAMLPVRVLRSAWVYLLVALAVLLVMGGLLARWSYDNNDWVRYHVQELIGQVHALTYTQPDIVPTPSTLGFSVAAAPVFTSTATTAPPTPAARPTPQPPASH